MEFLSEKTDKIKKTLEFMDYEELKKIKSDLTSSPSKYFSLVAPQPEDIALIKRFEMYDAGKNEQQNYNAFISEIHPSRIHINAKNTLKNLVNTKMKYWDDLEKEFSKVKTKNKYYRFYQTLNPDTSKGVSPEQQAFFHMFKIDGNKIVPKNDAEKKYKKLTEANTKAITDATEDLVYEDYRTKLDDANLNIANLEQRLEKLKKSKDNIKNSIAQMTIANDNIINHSGFPNTVDRNGFRAVEGLYQNINRDTDPLYYADFPDFDDPKIRGMLQTEFNRITIPSANDVKSDFTNFLNTNLVNQLTAITSSISATQLLLSTNNKSKIELEKIIKTENTNKKENQKFFENYLINLGNLLPFKEKTGAEKVRPSGAPAVIGYSASQIRRFANQSKWQVGSEEFNKKAPEKEQKFLLELITAFFGLKAEVSVNRLDKVVTEGDFLDFQKKSMKEQPKKELLKYVNKKLKTNRKSIQERNNDHEKEVNRIMVDSLNIANTWTTINTAIKLGTFNKKYQIDGDIRTKLTEVSDMDENISVIKNDIPATKKTVAIVLGIINELEGLNTMETNAKLGTKFSVDDHKLFQQSLKKLKSFVIDADMNNNKKLGTFIKQNEATEILLLSHEIDDIDSIPKTKELVNNKIDNLKVLVEHSKKRMVNPYTAFGNPDYGINESEECRQEILNRRIFYLERFKLELNQYTKDLPARQLYDDLNKKDVTHSAEKTANFIIHTEKELFKGVTKPSDDKVRSIIVMLCISKGNKNSNYRIKNFNAKLKNMKKNNELIKFYDAIRVKYNYTKKKIIKNLSI